MILKVIFFSHPPLFFKVIFVIKDIFIIFNNIRIDMVDGEFAFK